MTSRMIIYRTNLRKSERKNMSKIVRATSSSTRLKKLQKKLTYSLDTYGISSIMWLTILEQ